MEKEREEEEEGEGGGEEISHKPLTMFGNRLDTEGAT